MPPSHPEFSKSKGPVGLSLSGPLCSQEARLHGRGGWLHLFRKDAEDGTDQWSKVTFTSYGGGATKVCGPILVGLGGSTSAGTLSAGGSAASDSRRV